MTVVRNTATAPGGGALANARVRINLVTRSAASPGYTPGGDIVGILDIRADESGFWSADLVPNASITPANTYYRVIESSAVSTFVVPATGGPYNLSEVLAASPPTPSAPGMTGLQAAANGTVAGVRPEINLIAGTNTTITAADNPGQNRVDVTINATGGGGGGAVSSVNTQTGAVVLNAANVGAIATAAAGAASGVATLDGSSHLTASQAANLLTAANNLSDLPTPATARTNLGLGGAATAAIGTGAGTVAAGNDSRITGAAQKSANLSDLASTATARTNLGLGSSATANVGTTTGTVAAGDDSRITGAIPAAAAGAPGGVATLDGSGHLTAGQAANLLAAANNLSELPTPATARGNLGLGGAATLNVGTTAGTVAAGDDSRITGAAQKSANLSDLANAGTARTNLGLGGAAVLNVGTGAGTVAAGNDSRITGALQGANNLSDVATPATARTNLGLGGAATLNVGTTAGTVAAGDDSRITGSAQKSANLSDLANAGTARTNLGLGNSATANFDATVADLQPNGVAALGGTGKVIDAGHSHPSPPHQFPITKYGAVGDIQCVNDGAMNASAVLTSASGKFVAGDVGKAITVKGALTSGQTTLVTTIASYQSATQVTLTAAATVSSGTGLQVLWGTDNTSFIQSAIADAFAYAQAHGRVGEVYTPPATGLGWMVSGALKLTDSVNAIYNSQLTIPLNSDRNPKVTITFRGAANSGSTRHWNQDYPGFNPSTWFSAGAFDTAAHQSTTGANAVSNAGNPSVLGGPTGKNGYGVTGTNPVYNNVLVELRDMSIMTTHSASGWTYSPFNFHGCAGAHLTNCSFGTNGVIQYYTGSGGANGNTDFLTVSTLSGGISIGGLLPGAGNNASNRVENCVWNGGYTYGPLITEHTVIDDVTILYCWSGFCPAGTYGDGGSGAGALHAIAFNQLCVEACSYHVNVFGAGASGIGPILHGVLDTEGTIQFRDNPNNGTGLSAAAGEIRLAGSPSTVAISVGTGTGATGGTGLRIIKEQIYPGPLTFTSSPTLAINTPVVNTTWRPVTLYLTGGTGITTVQIGKLAGGASPTMTTVFDFTAGGVVPANTPIRLGPGQWLQINGTTLPTVVSCIAD